MGANLLRDIVEKRFPELQTNFKRAATRNAIIFDEDVFIDTYIKCCEQLEDTKMDEKQIIQYFWVSFLNNVRKEYRKKSYLVEKIDINDAFFEENSEEVEPLDEPYDDRRYKIYDTIVNYVKTIYGEDAFKAWFLHFADNKSYDELEELGYTNMNFHNIFRNINNSVKNKLPKENKEYNTIIKEIFRKK